MASFYAETHEVFVGEIDVAGSIFNRFGFVLAISFASSILTIAEVGT